MVIETPNSPIMYAIKFITIKLLNLKKKLIVMLAGSKIQNFNVA
mgnify:FL=1